MTKTKNTLTKTVFIIVLLFTAACSSATTAAPTPDAQATGTAIGLQQTIVALDATVQAYSALQTEAARATDTPLPTATLTPTITVTPGPLVIADDFSTDSGRWTE